MITPDNYHVLYKRACDSLYNIMRHTDTPPEFKKGIDEALDVMAYQWDALDEAEKNTRDALMMALQLSRKIEAE